jgi:hypothetical protein
MPELEIAYYVVSRYDRLRAENRQNTLDIFEKNLKPRVF